MSYDASSDESPYLELSSDEDGEHAQASTMPTSDEERGAKRIKLDEVVMVNTRPTAAPGQSRRELEAKRDQFLRVHANVYLPVLPTANKVATLLRDVHPGTVLKEAAPFRRIPQPVGIVAGTLKEYQLSGLSFLAYMHDNGMNCILADEMGLGKTVQTISLFAYLKEQYNDPGPHLVICPLSVLSAWMTELGRWFPSCKTLRFHGPMSERTRLKGMVTDTRPDVVVTTYEAYTAEQIFFKARKWGCCVLDEGHKIKNHNSQVAASLHGIGAQTRIILSGTPLQNNLVELWALLHFLCPAVFTPPTIQAFHSAFNLSLGLYDQHFLKKSQALLELIMLRRTKDGVRGELSVPRREETTLYVPLSPAQRFWYLRLLNRVDSLTLNEIFTAPESPKTEEGAVLDVQAEGDATLRRNIKNAIADNGKQEGGKTAEANAWLKMMNLLMQLRKCCNHPYLLPNAEAEPFEVAEHLVAASSKLVLLDKLLADILPKGEKVLLFSGFTRMLDILQDFLNLRGIVHARLDGSTSRPRRSLDIKLFQQPNSPQQVFLISTRAGGLGINLTAASTVVLFDQDWNPQVDIQAISRAHRIGQTKIVQVYRLVCQDSVEEQALTRLRKKLYLSAKVMGSMQNATDAVAEVEPDTKATEDDAPKMTRGELASILRGGAGALKWSTSTGSDAFTEFRNMTFADITERGKVRDEKKDVGIMVGAGENVDPEDLKKLEEEEEEAERILLAGREAVQTRVFEGAVHQQSNVEIRDEWARTVSRESTSRTVIIDGHSVMRDTIACAPWEAVKTITSDPAMVAKLSNSKRQKAKFEHEDFCLFCKDGGDVYQCASCPRSAHGPCSGYNEDQLEQMMSYFCPHHNCTPCGRTTQEAGGLLFRCQLCPSAFCEDCLGTGEIVGVGDVLPEFLLLGMGRRAQAYYIRCADCVSALKTDPAFAAYTTKEEAATQERMKEQGLAE